MTRKEITNSPLLREAAPKAQPRIDKTLWLLPKTDNGVIRGCGWFKLAAMGAMWVKKVIFMVKKFKRSQKKVLSNKANTVIAAHGLADVCGYCDHCLYGDDKQPTNIKLNTQYLFVVFFFSFHI